MNIFALITIITGDAVYNYDWDSIDGLELEDVIKEQCYGLVDINDTATVNVEILKRGESRRYITSLNEPDESIIELDSPRHIADWTYLYRDSDEKLIPLHQHQPIK